MGFQIEDAKLGIVFSKTPQKHRTEIKKLNWASIGLGIAVVGIEFGFLLVYKSGWNLGIANVIASLLLVSVAIYIFKDKIFWINISGILVCLIGLAMLNWKT